MAAPFATYPGVPEVLFTDLDGTLTTADTLAPATFSALAALAATGLPVVIVTGRPAGWADALARLWPVAAVIAENGAVTLSVLRQLRPCPDPASSLPVMTLV